MFKEPLNMFLRFQFFWNKVGTMQQALKNASTPARPLLNSMFDLGVPALVTQNVAYRNVLNNIPEHIKFALQIDKEYERAFQYCRFRGALVTCKQCRENQQWMRVARSVHARSKSSDLKLKIACHPCGEGMSSSHSPWWTMLLCSS